MSFIPYGTQWIDEDDIAAVVDVLRHGHLTQGSKVTEFESALANKVEATYCVVFSNATAALHCAVAALEIPKGKSGITSPNTFVASANCMAYNQLIPRFADIDQRTFNVTAESIQSSLTPNDALIIPVHFAGQPCDMAQISEVARRHGLPVIEDAAHAIGSNYQDGSPVGNCRYSDMTVFSFHPVKTMTTGEGGAVTTNDAQLYRKLLLLRGHGITKDPAQLHGEPGPWIYEQQALGFNYRLTDIQCALGIQQLGKLDDFKTRRREIVSLYNQAFQNVPCLTPPYEVPGIDSCFHLYVLQIEFAKIGKSRKQVITKLGNLGIGTQVHYIPVHTQPWYRNSFGYESGMCPNGEAYYEKALSIPLYPKMDSNEVNKVIGAVREVIG